MLRQITAQELKNRLAEDPTLLLVDVREADEHAVFNIGGWHIPLGEIMQHAGKLPKDRDVVLYCKRGIRSAIAIQRLEERYGFTNLVNLQGGLMEWPTAGK